MIAAALLAACAARPELIRVQADIGGKRIDTTVDAPIARYYAEHYVAGRRGMARWDATLEALESAAQAAAPETLPLGDWARAHSPDLAALVLAQALHARFATHPVALAVRDEHDAALRARDAGALHALRVEPGALFVFVPGWLYATDPTTGADFAAVRTRLERHGARTLLLRTGENRSVEANARFVARELRRLAAVERHLVVVSGSKGGPEAARALAALRDEPAGARVAAWLNVGGLLRGTPLAEAGLRWPACWYLAAFVVPDASFEAVRSLAALARDRGDRAIEVPRGTLVVNYVGIPLSGQVTPRARDGYERLKAGGPTDGIVPVGDAIVPGALTLAELGADHYFGDAGIGLKTLAIARVLARIATRH